MGAFLLAALTVQLTAPLAIRIARRLAFYDHPGGYKAHARSTPYLGGAALLTAFLVGVLVFSRELGSLWAIFAGAVALWAVGTLDDRVGLPALPRVLAAAGTAAVLWAAGLGWSLGLGVAFDLTATVIWVVGVVNAFNLMDNVDGAAGSVAAASAAGVGLLAVLQGTLEVALIALALCGACLGFLRFNLAAPARIFLGDGGSMPLGLVLAASVMALPVVEHLGWAGLLVALLLVGLPAFDTILVVLSRRRRGAPVFSGGRDHITHRLLVRLRSPRAVAATLAAVQMLLCAVAVVSVELSRVAAISAAAACLLAGALLIALLESEGRAPAPAEPSP